MKKCFECETTEDLHEHHVVPKSRGGTKTVTLCYQCHMKAHGRTGKGLNHKKLTREGLARAKARGVKLGTHNEVVRMGRETQSKATNDRLFPLITEARKQGLVSLQKVAAFLNDKGVKTPKGKIFTKTNLSPIMKRYRKEILMEEK
tara:strand:+ start:123 stop:560 length:438 start_codon:yes stop_codon:yes gene_type:complete